MKLLGVDTKLKENWGSLEPLAKLVVKGELDGLFLSHEIVSLIPETWPDGTPWVSYRTAKGQLLFREGAYAHYGFTSATEFHRAIQGAGVNAKTLGGVVSLGMARKVHVDNPVHVMMKLPYALHMRFLCESREEALKVRDLLLAGNPGVDVVIADTELSLFMGALPRVHPSQVISQWGTMPVHAKGALKILFAVTLIFLIIIILFFRDVLSFWVVFVFGFCSILLLYRILPTLITKDP